MLNKIKADVKTAMRNKEIEVRDILRMVLAKANGIAKEDKNREVTDKDVMTAIHQQIKQNKDVISIASENGRNTDKEQREVNILMSYLPKQKTEGEVRELVASIVEKIPVENRNPKARGLVMKELSQYKDVLDMKVAGAIAAEMLQA